MADSDVYDFGIAAQFEDDAKGGGARFLSVEDDGSSREAGGDNKSILEKLAEKAAAAVEARRPQVKKREIKARFGGARGAIADEAAGGDQSGGLDLVEAEFRRELEDNGGQGGMRQSFLPAHEEDDEDEEGDEAAAKPFFFTEDIWEEIDYNQRKQKVVEELAAASDRVSQAQVALPQLKVENDRLQHTCRQLEREQQELEAQEKKIFQRYPEFKKKFQQGEEEKEDDELAAQAAAQAALSAEEAREQKRHEERLRRRMLKRRNLAMQGLSELEENERDKGEILVAHTSSVVQSIHVLAATWRLGVVSLIFALDPYRTSFVAIRTKMPRAVAYFRMLQRTNLVNCLFVIAAVPQMIQWIRGARKGFCSDDTLIMPCVFRYSSLQRYVLEDDAAGAAGRNAQMSAL